MITAAIVDIEIADNGTWQDAFQFDPDGTWSLTGQSFIMEVKGTTDDTTALFTLSTSNGRVVVDSVANRMIHFNVDKATLQAALTAGGEYVYDLVMFDGSNPAVRTPLMKGKLKITRGVTQS